MFTWQIQRGINAFVARNERKKISMTEQVRDRIRGLLVKAGDDRKKALGNIRGLVAVLQEDMADHRETIMISLIECGKYLPTKSGIYGSWLALMNPTNRVFVSETINGIFSELRYTVAEGKLEVASCLLRLLIDCANSGCLSSSSLFAVMRSIVQYSVAAGFKRAEFGLYLVASSLPWISPATAMGDASMSALIEEVIAGVSNLTTLAEYQARKALVSPYLGLRDRLETAMERLVQLRESGWESDVLIRPYLMEGISEQLATAALAGPEFVHSVPTDDLSLFESIARQQHIPRVFLEGSNFPERFELTEILSNTIDLMSQSVGECAKALLRIPYVNESFESCLVDVILSRSISIQPRAFYHSLMHRVIVLQESVKVHLEGALVDLCSLKELSEETEFAIAELICFLFTNNDLNLNESLMKMRPEILSKFLQLTLRLAFPNTVRGKLVESLHYLLTEDKELGAGVSVERSEADQIEFQKVKESVRIKDGSEIELTDLLMSVSLKSNAYAFLIEALVENGSKTITHFTRLLELYGGIVRRAVELGFVGSEEEREAVLLWAVFSYWTKNSLRLEKCVELLFRQNLVSAAAIINRIEFHDKSLLAYKFAEMLLAHMLRERESLNLELAESQGTDRADQVSANLSSIEQSIALAVSDILAKSNEGFTQWFVKRFSRSVQIPSTIDIAQLF